MWGTLRRLTLCSRDGHGFCNDLLRAMNSLMRCEMIQPEAVVRAHWAHANNEMDEKTQLMGTLGLSLLSNYPNPRHSWARLLR